MIKNLHIFLYDEEYDCKKNNTMKSMGLKYFFLKYDYIYQINKTFIEKLV